MSSPIFSIRPCRPGDEPAVYHVCLATGDNGRDATPLFDDPEALGNIYVGPYMKLEPDLAFVLEDSQGVCGYILGALDSRRFYEAYLHRWLPALRERYREPKGPSAHWTETQRIYHEYYHPSIYLPETYDQYPSHLHIDLLPRAQGRGQGKALMVRLLNLLSEKGSPGVHLGVGTANVRAVGFYKKLGFGELARVGDVLYLGKRLG